MYCMGSVVVCTGLVVRCVGLAVVCTSVAVLLVICMGLAKAEDNKDAEICAVSCLETSCNGTTQWWQTSVVLHRQT